MQALFVIFASFCLIFLVGAVHPNRLSEAHHRLPICKRVQPRIKRISRIHLRHSSFGFRLPRRSPATAGRRRVIPSIRVIRTTIDENLRSLRKFCPLCFVPQWRDFLSACASSRRRLGSRPLGRKAMRRRLALPKHFPHTGGQAVRNAIDAF